MHIFKKSCAVLMEYVKYHEIMTLPSEHFLLHSTKIIRAD